MSEIDARRKLWTDALRSGKYKQGWERLRTGDKFCCLGVLCDLYAREVGIGEWRMPAQDAPGFGFLLAPTDILRTNYCVPKAVMEWVGLRDRTGIINRVTGESLASMNDTLKLSFAEIGDIIDTNPDGLFNG